MKNSPELTLCMGLVCDNFGVVKLLYWNYKQSMTGNNESPPRVKIVFDNLFLTNCYDFLNLETLHVASYTVGEFYISPDWSKLLKTFIMFKFRCFQNNDNGIKNEVSSTKQLTVRRPSSDPWSFTDRNILDDAY